jgi:hypothetical protein
MTMLPAVQKALDSITLAGHADMVISWFMVIQDPDSNDRHTRIHGDTEEGFALAHLALAGQASGPLDMDDTPHLLAALTENLPAAGVRDWVFACRVKGGEGKDGLRMAVSSPDSPEKAIGLGVVGLHLMIAGHLNSGVNFSVGPDRPEAA